MYMNVLGLFPPVAGMATEAEEVQGPSPKEVTENFLAQTTLLNVTEESVDLALAERDPDCYGVMARILLRRAADAKPVTIDARAIVDSRGLPAIEVDLACSHAFDATVFRGSASFPGEHKAVVDIAADLKALKLDWATEAGLWRNLMSRCVSIPRPISRAPLLSRDIWRG
jgi:hypothetical protein